MRVERGCGSGEEERVAVVMVVVNVVVDAGGVVV